MRFRGLTEKGAEEDLETIPISVLDDLERKKTYGGLDATWTSDLLLNMMCGYLKGKPRLTLDKIGQSEEHSLCLFFQM